MADLNTQLYNSTPTRILKELIYRRTDLAINPDDISYQVITPSTDASATDEFLGYSDGVGMIFSPTIAGVSLSGNLVVTGLRYVPPGGTSTPITSYSVAGTQIQLASTVPARSQLFWTGTARQRAYLTITANATRPNGEITPWTGSINLALDRLDIGTAMPDVLVYSDAFPADCDAFIQYMQDHYDYVVEDGEFFVVGDGTQTPIARGAGPMKATLDGNNQFQLEVLPAAMRWLPGSRVTVQAQTSNSIIPSDYFTFVGTPPNGQLGQPYNYTFQTANGQGAVTFSVVSGTPPGPVDTNTGLLHVDTLDTQGVYAWVMRAQDQGGRMITANFNMTVEIPPLTASPDTNTPVWNVAAPVTLNFNVQGGLLPYTYTVTSGSLPVGATIVGDAIEGSLEGTPSTSSTSLQTLFSVRVDDSHGQSVLMNFNATINDRSEAAIKASLLSKVVSWWEALWWNVEDPNAGWLNDTANMVLLPGRVVYDNAGRVNLHVTSITGGGADKLSLVNTGRLNSPLAYDFDGTAVMQSSTTAFNLTQDLALLGLINIPDTVSVLPGQVIYGRGGNVVDGGYQLSVGAGSDTLTLDLSVERVLNESDFISTLPVGSGNWTFVFVQRYDGQPSITLNSGYAEFATAQAGVIDSNNTQYLTLGSDAVYTTSTLFVGALGLPAVFSDKLWSDERKWIWNTGKLRHYYELGANPTLTATDDGTAAAQLSSPSLNATVNFKINLAGGDGTYIMPDITASKPLPAGITVEFTGPAEITVSGTITSPGTQSIDFVVVSPDGQQREVVYPFTVNYNPISVAGNAPDGSATTPYSYSYVVTGGEPPLTFSLVNPPPGWSVPDPTQPTIDYNAPAGGTVSWTFRVTDATNTTFDYADSADFFAPLVLTGTYSNALLGGAYSQDLTISGGNGTYYNPTVVSGSLTGTGLTLSVVGSALRLSGTPTGSPQTLDLIVAVSSGDGQTKQIAQTVRIDSSYWKVLVQPGDIAHVFDINDISSLYQDTAATIPVTAAGQTVRAVRDQIGGGYATNPTGVTLVWDSSRNSYYLNTVFSLPLTMSVNSAFGGNSDKSIVHVATMPGANTDVPARLFGTPIGNGEEFGLGNVSTGSGGYSYGLYQHGSGYGTANSTTRTSGFASRAGTKHVNAIAAYLNGSLWDSGTALAANITVPAMNIGESPNGFLYSAMVINRPLSLAEIQMAAAYPTTNQATLLIGGAFVQASLGTAYSSDITLTGGNGIYSNPRVTAGSLTGTGLSLSVVGNVLRLSGTPTGSAATISITVAVDSGDGQTAESAQEVVVAIATRWSPIDKNSSIALSSNNAVAQDTTVTTTWKCVRGEQSKSSGKWYFEVDQNTGLSTAGQTSHAAGVANSAASLSNYPGSDANGWAHLGDGYKAHSGYTTYGNGWYQGNRFMVAVDIDAGKIWFGMDGTWFEGGDPANGLNPSFTGVTGTLFPIAGLKNGDSIRLVPSPSYGPPAGFAIWNTTSTAITQLQFGGANGDTSFPDDVAGNSWSASGVTVSTAKLLFGNPTAHFSGAGALNEANNLGGFGTGDFTIQMFVSFENISANGNQAFLDLNGQGGDFTMFMYKPTQQIYFTDNAGANVLNSGTAIITEDVYNHIALCRKAGTLTLYVEGHASGSVAYATDMGSTLYPRLGFGNYGGVFRYLDGYIGQFQICNSALYDGDFTPPSAPFSAP